MGIKNFVDFTRIDIIAAAQGHILFVVANIQISGFVEFTDISREQPALPQGGGGQKRNLLCPNLDRQAVH